MGSSYSSFSVPENNLNEKYNIENIENIEKNVYRVDQMKSIQKEGLELFAKKNQDYGDAFSTYGTVGVLVRIGDKISRYQSISNKGIKLINTESLRDTLIDLHNYSAMAIMILDENNKQSQSPSPHPPPSPLISRSNSFNIQNLYKTSNHL